MVRSSDKPVGQKGGFLGRKILRRHLKHPAVCVCSCSCRIFCGKACRREEKVGFPSDFETSMPITNQPQQSKRALYKENLERIFCWPVLDVTRMPIAHH